MSNGFVLPYTFLNGQVADASTMMADLNYMLNQLNLAFIRGMGSLDGNGSPVTGLADGVNPTDAATVRQIALAAAYQLPAAGSVSRTIVAKFGETVSIKDFGAVCDGVTSDNAAFAAAVASGAKRIYVPNGATIDGTAALTFSNMNGVHFVGDGMQASLVTVLGTTGNAVTFTNCQDCGFLDVGFQYAVEPTSGWVLIFDQCFEPVARVRMDYHYNGIWVKSGSEPRMDVMARYSFGAYLGVRFGGVASVGVYGATLKYQGDNPPPIGVTTFKAYAASTAYTLGQITIVNSRVYACTQAGTTGASSSPSATSGSRFANDLIDGSVKWRFLCNVSATHITQDSNAYSIRIGESFGLNGACTFRMLDSLGGSGTYPMWAYLGLESDHAAGSGISLEGGEGVYFNDNAWVGSSMSGNGIQTVGSFRGEMAMANTVRVLGNAQHGVLLNVGKAYLIQGLISGNSQQSTGVYHGVTTGSGVTDYTITGANVGPSTSAGATQGVALSIGPGNDRYIITGNNFTGNAYGPVLNHSPSSTRVYDNNTPLSRASGLLKIAAGQTSANFAHGLGLTPIYVNASVRNDLGTVRRYISTIDATNVTVNLSSTLAFDAFFDVEARLYG